MKKLITLFLVCLLAALCCACGESGKTSSPAADISSAAASGASSAAEQSSAAQQASSAAASSDADESKTLNLKHDGEYVVMAMKKNKITINSVADFSEYSVGYIDDTDSMVYAEYYDFKSTGMYNAPNDLHSGIMGGTVDLAILDKNGAAGYSDWEIVFELKGE